MSAVISLTPPTSVAAHSPTSSVVASAHPAPYGWQTHVVRPGDTLSDLAIAHRTTVGTLVPTTGSPAAARTCAWASGCRCRAPRHRRRTRPARRRLRWTGYTVHPGDTIGAIALRLGTSESGILAANGLQRTSVIHPGQRLRVSAKAVRAARAAAAPAMSTQRVRVRPGDTVGAIALRHGVTQASILKANALAPGSVIYAGSAAADPGGLLADRRPRPPSPGGRTPARWWAPRGVNRGYLAGAPVPGRSDTRAMIVDTARRHGLDPRLALAIAWQESAWSQRQVSVANAIGVMQVIPSSGAWASSLAGRRLDLLNTQDNITAGVVILRSLTRAAATEEQAVAGYYQGLAGVQAHGMYADTRAYVRSVLALKARM